MAVRTAFPRPISPRPISPRPTSSRPTGTVAASVGEGPADRSGPSLAGQSASAASPSSASPQPARAGARPEGPARPKLLVVEDDPNIVELLAASLRFAGFDVSAATNGVQAVAEARASHPDLVVLDVMLPDLDGFEVIRRMRDGGVRTPVVFLTARDSTEDKVRGLTLGGDDYVTKPFSLEELTARIRAVLRRSAMDRSESAVLRFADLELDEESHEVRRAGKLVSLSPTEFKLLRYLMLNAGRVLSKAQILDHVWQYDFRGDDSIVESYISYLRRKVDTVDPRLIHTLRGVGYVLRLPS